MPAINLCLRVHQPFRLKQYAHSDIDMLHSYDDDAANTTAINKVADECYLPANKIILEQIKKTDGAFKLSFSISGIVLELLQQYRTDVIESFRALLQTGCVEILAETYCNSLSWLHSRNEWKAQVEQHSVLVKALFGVTPVVFRNTELIYNNELATCAADLGFKGILCEGLSRLLKGRTPNQLYSTPSNDAIGVLLRNVELSDDIAFRFGESGWSQHPLTAQKFAEWIHQHSLTDTSVINLFFDYETFGVHKQPGSGIFNFLEQLPEAVLTNNDFSFQTPEAIVEQFVRQDIYDVPSIISWEDKNNDCCLWSANVMQHNTIRKIYRLENMVLKCGDAQVLHTWRKLQTVDYFYYMSAHQRCEGDSYHLLNPFTSAGDAFQTYNNILTDFEIALIRMGIENNPHQLSSHAYATLY